MTNEVQDAAPKAGRGIRDKSRSANPCDGCALRRVRCEGGRPCKECQKRCLNCTSLRVSKKRGPKGPRQTTSQKIRSWQRDLEHAAGTASPASQGPGDSFANSPSSLGSSRVAASPQTTQQLSEAVFGPLPNYTPCSLEAYCKFLGIFRERLYSVWPVLSCGNLISRLVSDKKDYEAWALAASVCAGVIAQLRLPEHCQAPSPSESSSSRSDSSQRKSAAASSITSHHFANDACHFRSSYEYRERPSVSSLLTSFFLHIYCANSELLTTAGFHLRESLTQAHMLRLHRADAYLGLSSDDRELRLRVYWVLFVSERTYCIQNGLPVILRPISQRPSPDEGPEGCSASPILSFLHLTNLFTFLDGNLIEPPSVPFSIDTGSAMVNGGRADDSIDQDRARRRVAVFQSCLGSTADGVGLDETQRVDIFVTRNWIRILLWEYTVRHFTMSYSSEHQAFSILLPALVAHEMLGLFAGVSGKSICAHGYGMELKVFRIADSLIDVLACGRPRSHADGMLVGSRDALHSLERVLATVGGADSVFLSKLRHRMAEVQLPVTTTSWLQLPWVDSGDDSAQAVQEETSQTFLDSELLNASGILELGNTGSEQFPEFFMEDTHLLNNQLYENHGLGETKAWVDDPGIVFDSNNLQMSESSCIL